MHCTPRSQAAHRALTTFAILYNVLTFRSVSHIEGCFVKTLASVQSLEPLGTPLRAQRQAAEDTENGSCCPGSTHTATMPIVANVEHGIIALSVGNVVLVQRTYGCEAQAPL